MKVKAVIPVGLLIGMVVLSGCALRRSSEKEAWTDSIPSNVNFVASVRMSEMLADADIASPAQSFFSYVGEPQTLEDELATVMEETGIDLREVDGLHVFGDLESDEYIGILFEGGVAQEPLLAALEEILDESPQMDSYKGHDLYIFEEEGSALVWLDPDTLLISRSDLAMAHDVIDVIEGDAEPASGPVIDLLGEMGDPWIKAVFEVPGELLPDGEMLDGDQIFPGLDLGLLTDIQLLGLVVDKNQSILDLEVSLQYSTRASAEEAVDVFKGLITVVKAFMEDEQDVRFFDRIEISSVGSTAIITYSATAEELVSELEGLSGLTFEGLLEGFEFGGEQIPVEIPIKELDDQTTTPTDGPSILLAGELNFPATGVESREHIPTGQSARSYSSNPPTSGSHWSAAGVAPTAWGIKSGEVPDEALVHNLEHGGIIIHYRPTTPQSIIDQLTSFVQQQPNYPEGYILAPRSNLPSTITLSTWEYYLPLFQINEKQIIAFIRTHYDQAPESLQGGLR